MALASAGQIVRVPLGSCDFSLDTYTFEKRTDSGFIEQVISNTSALLSSFSLTDAHTNIMPILQDALARNPRIKLMLSPWSPPAWMKTSNSLGGGSVRDDYLNATAEYYAQAVSGFAEAGARPWALTVQNEPTQEAAYPSTLMSPQMQSALASRLRGRLGQLGFGHVKLIGHDNNYERWQDAADTINANTSALDGVGWHCYKGSSDQINQYKQALNSSADGKEVHFTECSGTITGQSRWSGMSWWLNNVFKPLTALSSRSVLVWNLALDKKGDPHLKTAICDDCAGALDISSPSHFMDPWFALGEQMYVLNHYGAAATSLEGQGGGPAYRIDVTFPGPTPSLSGSDLACLSATSFAAPVQGNAIVNPSTRKGGVRMGLILENDCDNAITIKMSVDGRRSDYGVQPGLSTLVWVAP